MSGISRYVSPKPLLDEIAARVAADAATLREAQDALAAEAGARGAAEATSVALINAEATARSGQFESLQTPITTLPSQLAVPYFSDIPGLFITRMDQAGDAVPEIDTKGKQISPASRVADATQTALNLALTPYYTDDPRGIAFTHVDPNGWAAAGVLPSGGTVSSTDTAVAALTAQATPAFYLDDRFCGRLKMMPDGTVLEGQRTNGVYQIGPAPLLDWRVSTIGTAPTRQVVVSATGMPDLAISTAENVGDNYGASIQGGVVTWINKNAGVTTVLTQSLFYDASTLAPGVTDLVLVVAKGQSNTVGDNSLTVVTTTPPAPGRVLMFQNHGNGGPRVLGNDQSPIRKTETIPPTWLRNCIDAKETLQANSGECLATQCGYELVKRLPSNYAAVVANVAIGSTQYSFMSPGGLQWSNFQDVVRAFRMLCGLKGLRGHVVVPWSGQEAELGRTQSSYNAMVLEEQSNVAAFWNLITAGTDGASIYVDGISDWALEGYADAPGAPFAQLQAAVQNPGIVGYATPTYLFNTNPADGVHALGPDQALKGAYFGRAIANGMQGNPPQILYPLSASISGNVVMVAMNVPTLPLNLTSPIVSNTPDGNYGVTCARQDTGVFLPVSSVTVSGSNLLVTINRTGQSAGVTCWIEFACHSTLGVHAGPTTGPHSPICDSSPDMTYFGRPMQNHVAISRVGFALP